MTKEEFLKIDTFRKAIRALKANPELSNFSEAREHMNYLGKTDPDPALRFFDKDGIHWDPMKRE